MSFKNKLRFMIMPAIIFPIVIVILINFFITSFQMRDMQYEIMLNRGDYIVEICNFEYETIKALGMENVVYYSDATKRKVLDDIKRTFSKDSNIRIVDISTGELIYVSANEDDSFSISSVLINELMDKTDNVSKINTESDLIISNNKMLVYSLYSHWNWVIVQTAESSFAYGYIYNATLYSIVAALLFIGITSLVIYKLSNTLSYKIEKLEKGTILISENNFDINISIEDNDEFGNLADKFNIMALELKKRQSEIVNQKEWLEVVISGINDALIAVDMKSNIQFLNTKAEQLTGYKKEQALGENICDVFKLLDQDNPLQVSDIKDRMMTLKGTDFDLISKKGKTYKIAYDETPIVNEHGECIGKVIVFRDITAKYMADENQIILIEQLKISKEKAEAANIAKSQFLANMSHEIRTPLNGIVGMNELLNLTQLTEEQRGFINAVSTSSEHLIGIINDILAIEKIESGKIELNNKIFGIEKLITTVVNMLNHPANKKAINIFCHIDKDVPEYLEGDASKITQVIVNLLSNSIKFSGKSDILLSVTKKSMNDRIEFSVTDNGIGISENSRKDIFLPFVQGDLSYTKQYQGTGLGLTISKRLVTLMGGNIGYESEVGIKTKFHFDIQLKSSINPLPGVDSSDEPYKNLKVLLIADNPISKTNTEQILDDKGMTVLFENNASDGLKILASESNIDLVILDLYKISGQGLNLAKKIKSLYGDRYLTLVFTNENLTNKLLKNKDSFGEGSLIRPILRNKLLDKITEILNIPQVKKNLLSKNNISLDSNNDCKKILIVEDNEINMTLTDLMLQKTGDYDIIKAVNGIEAIKLYKSEKPDVIFMDIQMPVMNGFDAYKEIIKIADTEKLKKPVCIAMTAYAMNEERDKFIQAGMAGFLSKPFTIADIKAVVY